MRYSGVDLFLVSTQLLRLPSLRADNAIVEVIIEKMNHNSDANQLMRLAY